MDTLVYRIFDGVAHHRRKCSHPIPHGRDARRRLLDSIPDYAEGMYERDGHLHYTTRWEGELDIMSWVLICRYEIHTPGEWLGGPPAGPPLTFLDWIRTCYPWRPNPLPPPPTLYKVTEEADMRRALVKFMDDLNQSLSGISVGSIDIPAGPLHPITAEEIKATVMNKWRPGRIRAEDATEMNLLLIAIERVCIRSLAPYNEMIIKASEEYTLRDINERAVAAHKEAERVHRQRSDMANKIEIRIANYFRHTLDRYRKGITYNYQHI